MKQMKFELRTITPMFMSGEDQAEFELRPPSIKGLMRFWWRAYYWGKCSEEFDSEKIQKDMEEREGKIFGTASEKGSKSAFSIRIQSQDSTGILTPFPKHLIASGSQKINILEYLAYGTYEYKRGQGNVFIRKYLPPDSNFSAALNIYNEDIQEDVLMSFYLLSTLGGCGAKSRNGFGNFFIDKIALEDPAPFQNFQLKFPFPLSDFFNTNVKNSIIPEFAAFSNMMKIFKLPGSYNTWDKCLAKLGEVYKNAKAQLDEGLSCEKRQFIACPIRIQKRVGGRWKTYDTSFLERRSKPYFMRIVKNGNIFEGYIIYLLSTYCQGLEKDKMNNRINHDEVNRKFLEYCEEFNYVLLKHMQIFYHKKTKGVSK